MDILANYQSMSDKELRRHSEDLLLVMKKRELLKCHTAAISYNKKSHFYYTYIKDKTGKRQMIKRNNKVDLENYLIRYYEAEIGKTTFKDYFEAWMNQLDRTEATIINYYNNYLRAFSGSDFEMIRMQQIDLATIKNHLYSIASEYTDKTISNVYTIIRSVLSYASNCDSSIIEFEIPKFKSLPYKKKTTKKKKRVLTKKEAHKVIEYLDNLRFRTMHDLGIEFLFFTGLRVGELAALKLSDIEEDRIHVCRSETRVFTDKKNKKQATIVGDQVKTESSDRYVPLSDKAKSILDEALERYHETEYVFEHLRKRVRSQGFRKHFLVVLYRCDIIDYPPTSKRKTPEQKEASKNQISIHSTRRFFASLLHKNNVPDETIRKILGHSDIATTQRCYICDIDDDISDQIEMLNKIDF